MTAHNNQANNGFKSFLIKGTYLLAAIMTILVGAWTIYSMFFQIYGERQTFSYRILITNRTNGEPINNATVIIDTPNTPTQITTKTGTDGIASFNLNIDLANQAADITVTASEFEKNTENHTLTRNSDSQTIQLTPNQ